VRPTFFPSLVAHYKTRSYTLHLMFTFLNLPSIVPVGLNTVQVLYSLSPSRSGMEPGHNNKMF